jgi:cell wall-associated NlpC family hydrolase
MVTWPELQSQLAQSVTGAYTITQDLNLHDSPTLQALATQAQRGRQLMFQPQSFQAESTQAEPTALPVILVEDDYPGWIALADLAHLHPALTPYAPPCPSSTEIQTQLTQVIAFTQAAMHQPNHYLWGGTVGPHYDCSGLMQHAFSSCGIWLPRDAYQQEAFVQPLLNPGDQPEALTALMEPGDLIFFGTPAKATHVALYLGNGCYIHSSGQDQGRNGIGLDSLTDRSELVSQTYYAQVRGAGRVIQSYQPRQSPNLAS